MAELITLITTIFTAMIDWSGDVIAFMLANPVTMLPIGLGVVGAAVGLVKSFVHR